MGAAAMTGEGSESLSAAPSEPQRFEVNGNVQVRIVVSDIDAIERVIGPKGDEWRSQFYNLETAAEVVEHWAYNAIANGIDDAYNLDGWADLPKDAVTFEVTLCDLEMPASVDDDWSDYHEWRGRTDDPPYGQGMDE